MNPRTTVLLVITALILGAILYWDHRRSVTTEEAERRAKKLIELKADEVVRLELVRSNLAIVVVKQDNRWEIREPIVARADDHAVNAILDQLEFAQRQRTIPEDELSSEALRDFGLLNPSLQLAVRDKTGTHTIFFGAETATKDAVYARVQGQKQICVVPKHVFEQANLPLDSLRSRVLMDFSVGAATRLEIKVAERVIGLAKSASKPSAEPRWSIVKPFHARADQRKVADLLAGLSAIRVSDFVSETAKDIHFYRLDEPRMELTVGTADRTITLLVGGTPTNDASKVYVKLRNTDPVYTVRADSAKKFDLHVNDLRDTQVLGFHEEDIHRIEVATPAEKVTLVKTAAFWNVAGPVAIPA
ncbi:MAG: DUF4340 domain-containing protein, partial [Verrucomicrobiae bacterium]|nr:DUF4340 domain-containing protein [Verrucomicrobiae bacterium]